MKKSIRTFPALLLAGILSVTAQPATGADDPFVRDQTDQVPEGNDLPKFVSVCLETFSLELAEAASLYHGQPNDVALYKEITARVAKGKAKQEGFVVSRARSGERATLKNASEFLYPVSYLPVAGKQLSSAKSSPPKPSNPAAAAPAPASPAPAAVPATSALPFPTEFESRDVGLTLVIEPTIGGSDKIIDLRIVPTFVTLADRAKWSQGDSGVETPVFETQQLETASTLLDGRTQLLGTMSRPPVSKVDADSAGRIWFAFVTAKVVSVPRQ
jgi:hypothetical protein